MTSIDTIVAQASPPGRGGVSIVRISGTKSIDIAKQLFKKEQNFFKDKQASFVNCFSNQNELIDEGLSIFFKAPRSFTGEDVVEFQCHGSPLVVDNVLKTAISLGARLALPGEFSERAFLNGKIDLVQAEAIADLIDSQSRQAAKNAIQTLKGVFSERINKFNKDLVHLRIYLEASIDFPDEEAVDFISEGKVKEKIKALLQTLLTIKKEAEQGQILQEGLRVVLAGEPNAGKSSLLNILAQKESAIVTDIAGTTRDVLKEQILINGVPIKIIDTAGLRESKDIVEKEGIRRAWNEIENADLVLYLVDTREVERLEKQAAWINLQRLSQKLIIVENKIDLTNKKPVEGTLFFDDINHPHLLLSTKTNEGVNELKNKVLQIAGIPEHQEGKFSARRRHIDAIERTEVFLLNAQMLLDENTTPELVAEDLRLAQQSLNEITGEFTPDDLLGAIFSSFCIGK